MQFEKVIIFVKQTHHHNIFITNMIITLQENPLVAKVIPSCLLALGIVMRSTKTTRFVSKWCPEYRSALAVLPTRSVTLVRFPTHLLLEVTARYMSVGEPD